VLVSCLRVRAVWSSADDRLLLAPRPSHQLIVFADTPTLLSLRRSERLHRADARAAGGLPTANQFGECLGGRSGCRLALRALGVGGQVNDELAYFDESKWSFS
jgi:hypothetical protein